MPGRGVRAGGETTQGAVTFARDVAPILRKCSLHHPDVSDDVARELFGRAAWFDRSASRHQPQIPPWFLEKGVGIQHSSTIGRWRSGDRHHRQVDRCGAPSATEGFTAEAVAERRPVLARADAGSPDLVVSERGQWRRSPRRPVRAQVDVPRLSPDKSARPRRSRRSGGESLTTRYILCGRKRPKPSPPSAPSVPGGRRRRPSPSVEARRR